LPVELTRTIIVPLIKHKTGNTNDKNNYRPIALVTASSKIFELVLLEYIENYIDTTDNQFGFKRKHGTDLCIYSLKNVIAFYRSHHSPVFSCFLDASRAFDRVNYWTLFSKLIKVGVSIIIVRLLCFWYNSQEFCIKWGTSTSDFFLTTNGVRQGGILSPQLFSFYLNDLSLQLTQQTIGCYMDCTCVNHFFYADDMCILAPSALGLQFLLNICAEYGLTHDILFHPIKSKCLVFTPAGYKLYIPDVFMDNKKLEYTQHIKYLGIWLCNNFRDDKDMKRQLNSLYASANSVLSKFTNCSVPIKCILI